jgi:hypothetical protein
MNNNENDGVDVNVLVRLYNNKLSSLTNQNILLEAKLQTLISDFSLERDNLLAKISELSVQVSEPEKLKSSKKSDNYQNSEVE